jgi:hypothetical protein
MDIKLELTLQQQFRLQAMKRSLSTMEVEEVKTLLLESVSQMMVKDNVIKGLLRGESPTQKDD